METQEVASTEIQTLSAEEVDEVSGGFLFLIGAWAYNHGGGAMYQRTDLGAGTWG